MPGMGDSAEVSTIEFGEFDHQERAIWLATTLEGYTQQRISAGSTPDEAQAAADRWKDTFVPNGEPAHGLLAGHVRSDGDVVGSLCLGPREVGSPDWWVWDIEIRTERRGEGLGRRAMLVAEELAAANGAQTLGLNVFGHNTVARSLYESLDYETMTIQMVKRLPGSR